jgi:elongation of very long chain fatty acids protein 7
MTTLMDRLGATWTSLVDEYSDPRVKDWPLMQSPWATVTIVAAYVLFVKQIGPQMMKHRKPYELRGPIIAYNLFQVILSTYIFYKAAAHGWLTSYSWRCEPLDRSTTGSPMQV